MEISKVDLTLTVLIVDDDTYKADKIKAYVSSCSQSRIIIARDQISAQRHLISEQFDLLILDMQLPNRFKEDEPDKDGGLKILEELEMESSYKQPKYIIVLTEYEDLRSKFQESFSDIASIQFDISSTNWQTSLSRVISRLTKLKIAHKKIVYCEGTNAFYYNLIGFTNLEFRGLSDSRAVYLSAKNEKENFSLRDRDFLTRKEIEKLKIKHGNYLVLDLYCFENYLYHPDNIVELFSDFNKEAYIQEIRRQKKSKIMTIVQDYKLSRNAYFDLNDDAKEVVDKKPEEEIITSLESDDFNIFYPYFDMAGKKDVGNKKSFDKTVLAAYNLEPKFLVKTVWFKNQMSHIFKPII